MGSDLFLFQFHMYFFLYSYVSGVDYYKSINEQYGEIVGKKHLMPPNPTMLLVSCDCDVYANWLCNNEFGEVYEHLANHVRMLVAGGTTD